MSLENDGDTYEDYYYNSYLKSNYYYKFVIKYDNSTSNISITLNRNREQCAGVSAYYNYNPEKDSYELNIASLYVVDSLQGKSIATFLLFMIFDLIFKKFGNIHNISIKLDDMSKNARMSDNIYKNSAFHYDERKGNAPEMTGSLNTVHRATIIYLKNKIGNDHQFFDKLQINKLPNYGGSKNTSSKLKIKEKKLKEKIKEKKLKEKIKEKKLKEKIKEKKLKEKIKKKQGIRLIK